MLLNVQLSVNNEKVKFYQCSKTGFFFHHILPLYIKEHYVSQNSSLSAWVTMQEALGDLSLILCAAGVHNLEGEICVPTT